METLYIVIPAYNEEENIEKCIIDWYPIVEKIGEDSRIILIDDGSEDFTFSRAHEMSETFPQLEVLHKDNGGHGSAVLYGYRYALDSKADWVFQTDSDGQTNPKEFDTFWNNRLTYDAIIGNRVVRGDGINRKMIENVVCLFLRLIFGVKLLDANAPFRLMKADVLQKYISKLPEEYAIPNIMLTTYFVYYNEKTLFCPITFRAREKGINSIKLSKLIKIGLVAIRDFLRFRKEM